mmetsp:Transcript_12990/g.38669  ORF Transcript_12990/g.38669 Transcript_12990/m.38669 type:complete len:164 (-) Transcript_12990:72-563(-)
MEPDGTLSAAPLRDGPRGRPVPRSAPARYRSLGGFDFTKGSAVLSAPMVVSATPVHSSRGLSSPGRRPPPAEDADDVVDWREHASGDRKRARRDRCCGLLSALSEAPGPAPVSASPSPAELARNLGGFGGLSLVPELGGYEPDEEGSPAPRPRGLRPRLFSVP